MVRYHFIASAVLALAAATGATGAAGEPLLGTWHTAPDGKDQTAEVRAARCGDAICGEIVRIFDAGGQVIAHPNTGKRLFWDMVPTGAGGYEGRVFVPKLGRDFYGAVTLTEGGLRVRGCAGPICQTTHWTRAD